MAPVDDPRSASDSEESGANGRRSGSANGSGEQRTPSGGLSDWVEALRDMAPYLDLGWRLAGSAAAPPLFGYLVVDIWFGTEPWGVLGGAVLGLATALLQLKRLQEELDR